MQRKVFDDLPDSFRKCCNKHRLVTKEILTSTQYWKEREIYVFTCVNTKCQGMKAIKINTSRNDNIVIQHIEKTKEVKKELEWISSEKIKLKNYRQPKQDYALGFSCIDGKEAVTVENNQECPIRRLSSGQKLDKFETDFVSEIKPEFKKPEAGFIKIK